jgi:hypothetical protein
MEENKNFVLNNHDNDIKMNTLEDGCEAVIKAPRTENIAKAEMEKVNDDEIP